MGEMTLFGSFNRTVPAGLLRVSRLARLGAHLSVVLRGCGGRKASLVAFGAFDKKQVWWKGQELDVKSPGFASY